MKKSFTANNPALAFMDIEAPPAEQDHDSGEAVKKPRRSKAEPQTNNERATTKRGFEPKKETKARRLHISVTEELYKRVAEAAEAGGVSINEYINQALAYTTKGGRRK